MPSKSERPQKGRKRTRKQRTRKKDISSSSESESSSSASSSSDSSSSDVKLSEKVDTQQAARKPGDEKPLPERPSKKRRHDTKPNVNTTDTSKSKTKISETQSKSQPPPLPREKSPPVAPLPQPVTQDPFESWYIRTLTQEFGDDLDKVRAAPDFKDSSVPILIHALKQGVACFSAEEKAVVLGERKGEGSGG